MFVTCIQRDQITGNSMAISIQGISNSPAVHFTLRSSIMESRSVTQSLHKLASRIGFEEITPPVVLQGDECSVQEEDPLAAYKVHARGFFVQGSDIISLLPSEISGFSVRLKNGNLFHIGLSCFYPSFEYGGRSYINRLAYASQWRSYVKTVKCGDTGTLQCVESHFKSLMLLREAERLGILMQVHDPYGQWSNPDRRTFEFCCGKENQLICSH